MSVYDHLEYRHLKYLIAVAETGSMSAAAARLHVSQSAISEQISALEEIFEIRIFERGWGGSKLTHEGRLLLAFARESLEAREHIIQTLQAIRAGSLMPLRLGFSPFIEKTLLETVTETYRNLLPGCEIVFESQDTDELINRLRNERLDAVLLTLPVDDEELRVKVLERERLVVCLRSDDPLASDVAIAPAALDGKLSVFDYQRHHPAAYTRLIEMLKELGITPRPSTPTMNGDHIQWLVKEGLGYALVRAGRPLMEGLVSRPIAGAHWTIDSAFVSRSGKQHPGVALLMRGLAKRFPLQMGVGSKRLTITARLNEAMRQNEDDQMVLFPADDRCKEQGHRSKTYRYRK